MVLVNSLQSFICGDILGIYILLNLIYKLLRSRPNSLGFKSYNSVIRAFIYVLKYILYSAVSHVGLYINIRVKMGRKVRVIRRHVSAAIYIALPKLYKSKTIPQALIQQLIIISSHSLLLKGIRELKPIFFITYIGHKGIIGAVKAIQYIIGNNII